MNDPHKIWAGRNTDFQFYISVPRQQQIWRKMLYLIEKTRGPCRPCIAPLADM